MSLSPAGMWFSVNVIGLKVSKEDNIFLPESLMSYSSVIRTSKGKNFLLRMKKVWPLGSVIRSYTKYGSMVCKNEFLVE